MSRPQSIGSTPTHPRDALITTSAAGQLELRQNNPQDCSNLIRASVDRATVEISRTIIALNATFSQQIDQARISASNGIKSAQDSATSTINIVVQSASVATSSAFSSVKIANLAVTSANAALTSATDALNTANLALTSASAVSTSLNDALSTANFALTSALSASTSVNAALFNANIALTSALSASNSDVFRLSSSSSSDVARLSSSSSSEVARLSSSLSLAQASLAAAQGGLVTSSGPQGQPTFFLSLNAAQIAGIVVGSVVLSILLGVTAGCLVIRMKRSRRANKIEEKNEPKSPTVSPVRPASFNEKDEKEARQPPPSGIIENPFLLPEELAPPYVDALPKNDALSVTSQELQKSDFIPTGTKLQRNFSLPRDKEGRRRHSSKTPKPKLESRAGQEDWTDIAEARKQAIEEASQGSAPISKDLIDVLNPTQTPPPDYARPAKSSSMLDLATENTDLVAETLQQDTATGPENPFEDVNTIISEVLGEQSRGRSREDGRRHVSPLRRNPVLMVLENEEPVPPLPPVSYEQRAVSPLRRNPVFQRSVEEEPVPPLPSLPSIPDKKRAISPLRRNPVLQRPVEEEPVPPLPPIQTELPLDKQRAISPLRRNPVVQRFSEQEPVPPLPSSLKSEEQRPTSPMQRDTTQTSPVMQEPYPPRPSSPMLSSPLPPSPEQFSPMPSPLVFSLPVSSPPMPSTPVPPLMPSSPVPSSPVASSPVPFSPVPPSPVPPSPVPPSLVPTSPVVPSPVPFSPVPPSPVSPSPVPTSPVAPSPVPFSPVSSSLVSASPMPTSPTPSPPLTAQTSFPLRLDLSTGSDDTGIDASLDEQEEIEWPEKAIEPSESSVSEETSEEAMSEEDTQEQAGEDPDESLDEYSDKESEEAEEAPEVDERVTRGRSMIRTSDIIEARLSAIAQARAKTNVPDTVREESDVGSIIESVTSPESSPEPAQMDRTESPPRRDPVIVGPPEEATPPVREESPLRRKPPVILKSSPLVLNSNRPTAPKPTALLRAAPAQPKAGNNAQFSQAFLMFKSLDSKNLHNAAAATSEVNHRALAGIHVPASLREQAVRNLSKSRERGKSRARDHG